MRVARLAACALAALACALCSAVASPVDHVVVLVLENRSYLHLLGFHPSHTSSCPVEADPTSCAVPRDPLDPSSELVHANADAVYRQVADPRHSYNATMMQVYGDRVAGKGVAPTMSGFVADYLNRTPDQDEIMACFSGEHVPTTYALASEFALLSRWFSGIPGPTEVNRLMVNSATSDGSATNNHTRLAAGYPQRTIFESLDDSASNATWGVYFDLFPTALFFDYPRRPSNWGKLHGWNQFHKDAAAGTLPSYSFLEPRYYDVTELFPANDNHPDHDVSLGERLVADVYASLRASPKWNRTLLLVTYDEHGGFPDPVPPPSSGVPSPDGVVADDVVPPFNFDRLGVRVPAIAVSPLIPRGTVVGKAPRHEYSHSSIPATVRELLAPDQPFLTARDAWSDSFASVLSLSEPRTDCPKTMPVPGSHRGVTPGVPVGDEIGRRPLHGFQKSMVAAAEGLNGNTAPAPLDSLSSRQAAEFIARETNRLLRRPVTDMAGVFGSAP